VQTHSAQKEIMKQHGIFTGLAIDKFLRRLRNLATDTTIHLPFYACTVQRVNLYLKLNSLGEAILAPRQLALRLWRHFRRDTAKPQASASSDAGTRHPSSNRLSLLLFHHQQSFALPNQL
jgi:hypothetical protein